MRLAVLLLAGAMAVLAAGDKPNSLSTVRGPSPKVKVHTSARSAQVRKTRRPAAYCAGCVRDSRGRIKRSESAKHAFQRLNPCPVTGKTRGRCPGYVIDHIIPLKRGGADAPYNMQWQTKAEAKAKDRVE